jgi:anaerobic selenocysteine-containing dehydrogenase
MSTVQIPGYCTLCRSRCGTLNTIRDGRLMRVEALAGHPTGHAICSKGRAAPEIAHDSKRLTHPLRRTKPKTAADPGWEKISWDQALGEIAHKLIALRADHGAETVAFALSSPSGTALTDSYDWLERLAWLYGSPNVLNGTEVCNWPKDFAHRFTFGHGMPPPDYARSDLIVLWGFNPANSWIAHAWAISQALMRGAKLIVVDPRRSGFAAAAHAWLPIKPGTDGILALGLAKLLIDSGRYDDEFVRCWTTAPLLVREDSGEYLRWPDLFPGELSDYVAWDEGEGRPVRYDTARAVMPARARHLALATTFTLTIADRAVRCSPAFALYARACAPYTRERVAALTGIAPDAITNAADLIASSAALSYHCWTGISQHANATQTERAIALLYALTGRFDRPGGNLVLERQPINRVNDYALLPPAQRKRALGRAQRPLGPAANGWITASDLYTAVLEGEPYRVRGLMAFGSNILSSLAEPGRGRRALEQLEFHVQCDLYETPTSRFADILLPINSAWEREGLRVGFENSAAAQALVQLRPQMVEPLGQSRSDLSVAFQVALRLGLEEEFFGGSIEAGWNHMLAPLGITVEQLRASPRGIVRPIDSVAQKYARAPDGKAEGFSTPSRRVEIYSETLNRDGQPGVPWFEATAQVTGAFPLILTTARNINFCHSQHRGIASLRRRATEPIAQISHEAARAHQLREGDWIAVVTAAGRARFRVRINARMHAQAVVAEYGWWQACDELELPGYRMFALSGSNYNNLIPGDQFDPVSGAPVMRSIPCRIVPLRRKAVPASARVGGGLG